MKNEFISALEFDEHNGALTFKGVRYFILRPETVMGMFKSLVDALGWEKGGEIFYKGGFEGGGASSTRFQEVFDFAPHGAAEYMCDMAAEIGWGRFKLEAFDAEKKIVQVTVKGSPFAEQWLSAGKPVCHFIRGIIGGMANALTDASSTAEEIACIAKGDDVCRFVVRG